MLTLHHIHHRFDNKMAIDDFSCQVEKGKILVILGQSGCGKSTLLHLISGLHTPHSGEVWLNQRCLNHTPPEKRQISLMFQDFALFPHLSAWQNVAFGLHMQGTPKAQAKQMAFTYLEEMGLSHIAIRKPEFLSGGERQRLALARALIVQPQLLLLDEPFSNLDTHLRKSLRELVLQHIRQLNIPAILVTHDPEEAFLLADEIAVMQQGKLMALDVPSALRKQPPNAQAAHLLGLPNIKSDCYLPCETIEYFAPNGEPCPVLAYHALPEAWRVVVQHPQWGTLEKFCTQAPHCPDIPVTIHPEHIVYFNNTQTTDHAH